MFYRVSDFQAYYLFIIISVFGFRASGLEGLKPGLEQLGFISFGSIDPTYIATGRAQMSVLPTATSVF